MKRLTRIHRIVQRSLILGAVLALSACSMFSSKDPRFEPAPLAEYEGRMPASVRWSASIGSGSGFGFIPYVQGQDVYTASASGQVSRVDLSTGRVKWATQVNKRLSAGVGTDGRVVAVAAPDGTVIALDSEGKELWKAKATSEVNIPPAVGDGVVVVRSSDYRVQAFDAQTGDELWNIQRPGPALALKTTMQMLLVDGMVVTGMPNGRVLLIDAATGALQWEGIVSQSYGATDLERISDVVGAPEFVGPLMCAASYQGRIICFDMANQAQPLWAEDFSTARGIGVNNQMLYAADNRDKVVAFDIEDGNIVWEQDALRNRRLTAPAVYSNIVAVGDFEGYIHFLAPHDGRQMARVRAGSKPITSQPVAVDGGVLVQTDGGQLVFIGV
ncbi:MAG TPA: outer membrane protein assembly factor BamB [Paenalcaligenes sp.]|nr:outer membrane protein assembly factor BamB [Paenalcaligenes sp.]